MNTAFGIRTLFYTITGGIAFYGLCLRAGVDMGKDAFHGVVFRDSAVFCPSPRDEAGDVSLSARYPGLVLDGLLGE